jgi:hypothetical protein
MRGAKCLTVFLCTFLVFGLNIASAKPPQTETAYGEAVLDGAGAYKINSDGGGAYTDQRLEGEDQIEVELNRGNLEETTAVFGRHCMICWPDCLHSERGVVPDFSYVAEYDEVHAAPGTTEGKMLDALMQALGGTGPESIYRFRVRTNTLGQDLQIRVDSVIWGVKWSMLRDVKGISEEELIKYFFFSGPDCKSTNEADQEDNTLQYNLRYEGVNIVETDPGKSWTIEPLSGPATLYVFKGQSGKKGKPNVYHPVDLVTYTDGLPFKIEITLPEAITAPGRFSTLTTCWGNIKEN